jgi:NADPH:quinone reductase-like Zn-dependent oxidoreductase
LASGRYGSKWRGSDANARPLLEQGLSPEPVGAENHVPGGILITGAAGGVGSAAHTAIATLREQGHRVRAMVRKLDARADTLRDMGAEVVVADMLDIIATRAAMQGC